MARRITKIIVIFCLSIVIANIYFIHWWVTVTDVTISPTRSSFFRRQVEYNQEEDQVLQTTKIPKFINTASFDEKYKVEHNIKTNQKDKENVGWEFHNDPPLPKEKEHKKQISGPTTVPYSSQSQAMNQVTMQ
jgi:hypothetical protein